MKRVVAITVMMVMVTTLFAFSVYAETPVQPLQVITYSDTTTNVRISGTAERLHYNIDSFQVVFMNPPNNYGTSCTPVLVSFRFYNASDIQAYVGQPEFELTATTGTGSVNTIIYGYDQISTDLFVAESSYSTAEVGRIGIGASNDFAYYTGFVIPPRTSLYFSCIVYVNASAYAQNNTGANEDVNQVTLSSLNLYSNQISFSTDYPYHNQPVDFTDILDAIDVLSDTVSTSSEMQSIIAALTYSGSTNVSTDISSPSMSSVDVTDRDIRYLVSRYCVRPYAIDYDFEIDSVGDQVLSNVVYCCPLIINLRIQNTKSGAVSYDDLPYLRLNNIGYGGFPADIKIYSNVFYNVRPREDNRTTLELDFTNLVNGKGIVPSGWSNTTIVLYYYFTGNPSLSVQNYSVSYQNVSLLDYNVSFADSYNLSRIALDIRELLDAYKSVNGNSSVASQYSDLNTTTSQIHQNEQQWYNANSSAIEQTGLSNFRFSQAQGSGINAVLLQFEQVWAALGSWNLVYIFALLLSLGTFIIRHEPTTRVKQYRSSVAAERAERISYYGRKNAEARASNSGSTIKSAVRRRK